MRYSWHHGFGVAYTMDVDADTFGQRLEVLRQVRGNGITPVDVVEDARPVKSPIHDIFEWDDTEAAEEWRIHQARNAMNSLRIVVMQGTEEREVIANLHIREENVHSYWPAHLVATDPHLMEKAVKEALAYMRGWEARYHDLEELQPIFIALREAEEQVRGRAPQRRRRQPIVAG